MCIRDRGNVDDYEGGKSSGRSSGRSSGFSRGLGQGIGQAGVEAGVNLLGNGRRKHHHVRGGKISGKLGKVNNALQTYGPLAQSLANKFGIPYLSDALDTISDYTQSAQDIAELTGNGRRKHHRVRGGYFSHSASNVPHTRRLVRGETGHELQGSGPIKHHDGRSARASIVRQVMYERGVSLPQASKIVKEEGLY